MHQTKVTEGVANSQQMINMQAASQRRHQNPKANGIGLSVENTILRRRKREFRVNLKSYLQCAKSFVNASPNTKVVDGRVLDDTLLVNNEKPPESNALQRKTRGLN